MASRGVIWIDHKQARICWVNDDSEPGAIFTISADVESHHKARGGKGIPLPGHLGGGRESHDDRRRHQEHKRFFQRIIDRCDDHCRLVLIGPGQARDELASMCAADTRRRFEILVCEPADHMTDEQIKSRARAAFSHLSPIDR